MTYIPGLSRGFQQTSSALNIVNKSLRSLILACRHLPYFKTFQTPSRKHLVFIFLPLISLTSPLKILCNPLVYSNDLIVCGKSTVLLHVVNKCHDVFNVTSMTLFDRDTRSFWTPQCHISHLDGSLHWSWHSCFLPGYFIYRYEYPTHFLVLCLVLVMLTAAWQLVSQVSKMLDLTSL